MRNLFVALLLSCSASTAHADTAAAAHRALVTRIEALFINALNDRSTRVSIVECVSPRTLGLTAETNLGVGLYCIAKTNTPRDGETRTAKPIAYAAPEAVLRAGFKVVTLEGKPSLIDAERLRALPPNSSPELVLQAEVSSYTLDIAASAVGIAAQSASQRERARELLRQTAPADAGGLSYLNRYIKNDDYNQ